MITEMIVNNEGDYSFINSDGYRDYISMGQAINVLVQWEMGGKTIHYANEYNVDKWWTT